MTYNPSIPLKTDIISSSQGQIYTNFNQANSEFGVEHNPLTTTTGSGQQGKHKYVTFQNAPSKVAMNVGECQVSKQTSGSAAPYVQAVFQIGPAQTIGFAMGLCYNVFGQHLAFGSDIVLIDLAAAGFTNFCGTIHTWPTNSTKFTQQCFAPFIYLNNILQFGHRAGTGAGANPQYVFDTQLIAYTSDPSIIRFDSDGVSKILVDTSAAYVVSYSIQGCPI